MWPDSEQVQQRVRVFQTEIQTLINLKYSLIWNISDRINNAPYTYSVLNSNKLLFQLIWIFICHAPFFLS